MPQYCNYAVIANLKTGEAAYLADQCKTTQPLTSIKRHTATYDLYDAEAVVSGLHKAQDQHGHWEHVAYFTVARMSVRK